MSDVRHVKVVSAELGDRGFAFFHIAPGENIIPADLWEKQKAYNGTLDWYLQKGMAGNGGFVVPPPHTEQPTPVIPSPPPAVEQDVLKIKEEVLRGPAEILREIIKKQNSKTVLLSIEKSENDRKYPRKKVLKAIRERMRAL